MYSQTVFVLAVILAYAGVFLVFRKKYLSLFGGIEYLFIGFFISFLPVDTSALKPLLYPFLGWIGLLIGLQLKFSYLKGLPRNFYIKVCLYSILSALPAGGVLYLLKFNQTAVIAAFALSSICYKSVAHFISARNKNNRFILFFVSFLPFISILLMFIFYLSTASLTQVLLYLSTTIAFSIILRMTMAILDDRGSVFLLLVGFILFISEACAVLKLSPLVVCFFIGIYISNFSHWKDFIFNTVYKDEKPLYTLFLILLGMEAGIALNTEVLLDILLIVPTMGLLKYLAFKFKPMGFSQYNWFLFLAPGGFAIAVMTDYWLNADLKDHTAWFSSFLISIVLLQFISIFMGKRKRQS